MRSAISLEELESFTDIKYEAKVTNTGKMGGAVSVLAFVTSDVRQINLNNNIILLTFCIAELDINVNSIFQVPGAPLKELFGFQKVYLDPGMSETVIFSVGPHVFETVDEKVGKEYRTKCLRK